MSRRCPPPPPLRTLLGISTVLALLPHGRAIAQDAEAPPTTEALDPLAEPDVSEIRVSFSFKGTPWSDVIDYMARKTGLPVIREVTPPNSTVDFIGAEEFTLDQALDVLNRLLYMHGQQIWLEGKYLMLSKLDQMAPVGPKFVGQIPDEVGGAAVITLVVPLNNAAAEATANQLAPLATKDFGAITALPQQNMLIIVDRADQARRIRAVIDRLDAEAPSDSKYRLFPLKHAKAEDAVNALKGLVGQRQKTVVIEKGVQRVVEDLAIDGVNLTPDPRTNSVIAVGPETRLRIVEELIELLDRPDSQAAGREMMTFELVNVRADEARSKLDQLFRAIPGDRRPSLLSLPDQNKLTVVGSSEQLLNAAALLTEIDPGSAPSGPEAGIRTPERRATFVALERLEPREVISLLDRLVSARQKAVVRYVPGPDGRSLIVAGPAADVQSIEGLIAGVDSGARPDVQVRQASVNAQDAAGAIARAQELYALTSLGQASPVDATLEADGRTLTLVGSREGVDGFLSQLRAVEQVASVDLEMRTIELNHADPAQLASKLSRLAPSLLDPGDGSAFVRPTVQALAELDSIVVRAEASQWAIIDRLIGELDQPETGELSFRVVRLRPGEAAALIERATQLYERHRASMDDADAGEVVAELDERSGVVLLSGRIADVGRFGQFIDNARTLLPPERTTRVVDLNQAQAADVMAQLRTLLDEAVSASPDLPVDDPTIKVIEATNSLLVTATEAHQRLINDFVRRLDRIENTDLPPLKLLQLRTADAGAIASMLREQYQRRSPADRAARPVDVQADAATNTLIVSAHADLFSEIQQFVEELNIDRDEAERVTELFPLKVARAEDVARAMERLYPDPPMPVDRFGRPMPWARESREVFVTADANSNSLIIEAPAERMESFKALAEKLDRVELPPRAELRAFRVVKADLGAVADTLRGLARTGTLSGPTEPGRPSVQVLVEAEPASSTLIVAGDATTFERVEQILTQLEAVPVERRLRILPISNAEAARVSARATAIYEAQSAGLLEPSEIEVSVNESTNSLEVVGDDEGIARFVRIIEELQREAGPPREVQLIELQYASADEVVSFMQDMLASSEPFRVGGGADPVFEAIEATNTLMVAAQPAQMGIIRELVRTLDAQRTAEKPPMRILRLRTTEAGALADVLSRVYAQRPPEERAKKPVEIIPDPATNTLLVSAHEDVFPEIDAIVTELNESQGLNAEGREIRIFPLRVARAEELARTIDQMYPEPPMPYDSRGRPRPDLRGPKEIFVRADKGTNALIVDAPVQRLAGFEQIVRQLDQQVVPANVEMRLYKVRRADLRAIAETIRELAESAALGADAMAGTGAKAAVGVSIEPTSRTLIVSGPAGVFDEVDRLVAELDDAGERPQTDLRMYPLAHARAERLVPLLDRLLQARLRETQREAGLDDAEVQALLDVAADGATNTLLISAPEALQQITEQLVRSLDVPDADVGRRVVRVLPLTYADANSAAETLRRTLPSMDLPGGTDLTVSAIVGSNAVLLAGAQDDLDKVEEVLSSIDVRPISDDAMDVATFELTNADAGQIATTVQRLLEQREQTDPRILMQQLRYTRGQLPQPLRVRVEADTRTNSLIVSGPKATVELAGTIIERLDRTSDQQEREVRLFVPQRGDADRLVSTVGPIIADGLGAGRGSAELVVDGASGAIVVVGRQERVDEAVRLLGEFDDRAVVAPEASLRVIDVQHAAAGSLADVIAPMLQDRSRWPEALLAAERAGVPVMLPSVRADEDSNRLIVSAPAALVELASQLVDTLDRPASRDDVSVRVFTLKRSEASSVAQAIELALASRAEPGEPAIVVAAEPGSNSVVVSGSRELVDEAAALVAELDESVSLDATDVRTVRLVHARAESVAPVVTSLLQSDTAARVGRLPSWAQAQYYAAAGDQADLRVAAEPRLNAVVITGPGRMVDVAERIVRELDSAQESSLAGRPVRFVRLDVADAAAVAQTLASVFEGEEPAPKIEVETESNSLIIRATPEQLVQIQELVDGIDGAAIGGSRDMRLIGVDRSRTDAALLAETLRKLLETRDGPGVEIIPVEELMDFDSEESGAMAPTDRGGLGGAGRFGIIGDVILQAAVAVQEQAQPEPEPTDEPDDRARVQIGVDPATNSLVLVGPTRAVERVAELARMLQEQLPAQPTKARVITLPDSIDPRGVSNLARQAVRELGRSSDDNPGGLTGPVTVLPDPSGSSLIVFANDADFETVGRLIGAVARPAGMTSLTVKVYPLVNLDARRAEQMLDDLISAAPRGRQARRLVELTLGEDGERAVIDPASVRITADPSGTALVIAAPADVFPLMDRFLSVVDQAPMFDRVAIRQYDLESAEASSVAQMLQRVFDATRQGGARSTMQARFVGDDRTNSVLVTATTEQHEEVLRLLGTLDVATEDETGQIDVIPIAHASPSDVQRIVEQVLLSSDASRRERVKVIGQNDSGVLVVRAPEEDLTRVRELVARVDVSDFEGLRPVRAVKLERADARVVANTLQDFFRRRGSGSRRGGGSEVAISGDKDSATLLISASDEEFEQIMELVRTFDAPSEARDVQYKIIPLENAKVVEVRDTLERMVEAVRGPQFFSWWGDGSDESDTLEVEFDERLNAVVLIGQLEGIETVEGIIASLDVEGLPEARLEMRAIKLENADAQTVARAIESATGTPGWRSWQGRDPQGVEAEVDRRSGTIVLIGRADRVEEAVAYATSLDDVASGEERGIESIRLRFAQADGVAGSLSRFFRDRARSNGQEQQTTVLGSRDGNILLLSGPEDELELARSLIQQMDQPEEEEGQVRELFTLRNADASEVAQIVREQFPRPRGSREGLVIVTALPGADTLIVSAPDVTMTSIDALIAQLDAPPTADEASIVTVRLETARAREVVEALDSALPESVRVTITPVERSNTLLLTGSDEAIALAMEQIELIDTQPAMSPLVFRRIVLDHAVAFEVSLTLRTLLRDLPSTREDPRASIVSSRTENSLLVTATLEQIEEIERIIGELDTPAAENRETEFIALRFADAEQTSQALDVFYGPFASIPTTPEAERVAIIAVPVSNSLLISAADTEWPKIRSLLEKLDSEEYDTSRQLEIIALKHADAQSLARAINEAFQAPLRAQLERERARQNERGDRRRDADVNFNTPTVLIDADETVSVTAEPLSNSLIVSATREDLSRIRSVVERVDVPGFADLPDPTLIPLRSGPATQLAQTLRRMYDDIEATRGSGPRAVVIVGDDRANALIVRADETELAKIRAMAEMLQDEGDRSRATVRTLRLTSIPATRFADTIRRTFGAVVQQRGEPLSVEVDRGSNALVVASSLAVFEQIEEIARELDSAPGEPEGNAPPMIGPGRTMLIVDLVNHSPDEMLQTLTRLGLTRPAPADRPGLVSEPVDLVPLTTRRAIAVVVAPVDVPGVSSLVRSLDTEPAFDEQTIVVVGLRTALAGNVVAALNRMIQPSEGSASDGAAAALAEQVRRLSVQRDGVDEADVALDLTVPIRIFAEGQTNSVVIASTEANVRALRELTMMLDQLPVGEAVVVRLFPMSNASAERVAGVIRGLFAEGERLREIVGSDVQGLPTTEVGRALVGSVAVSVDQRTNTLVVAGREEGVALVEVLIGQLDNDRTTSWIEPALVHLEHADAVELAETLRQVLVEGGDSPEAQALQRQIARYRVALDPDATPVEADRFAPLSSLLIVPEENLNALIVVGSKSNTAAVRELAGLLDVPAAAASNRVRVYPLEVAAADRVAGILREVFARQVQTGVIRAEDDPVIASDLRTNSLVVSTSERSFGVIESLIERLDAERSALTVGLHVIPVTNADVRELGPKIERLMRDRIQAAQRGGEVASPSDTFSIQPDPTSGSLIVAASEENVALVKELIEQLTEGAIAQSDDQAVDLVVLESSRVGDVLPTIRELYVDRENEDRGEGSVQVSANDRLNALVVRGTPDDVEAIREIVGRLDQGEPTAVTEIRRIELQRADAGDVVTLLQNVLAGRPINGSGRVGTRQAQILRFLQSQLEEQGIDPTEAEINGAIQEQVTLTAERRTNSIVVVAPTRLLVLIEALVADLDSTDAGAREIELFQLVNADAQSMARVLQDLFNLRQEGDTLVLVPGRDTDDDGADTDLFPVPDQRQQLAITIDPRTNSLLVSATEEYLEQVRKVVTDLDKIEARTRERLVFDLKNARAIEVAQTLREYFQTEADSIRLTLGDDRAGSLLRLLEEQVTVQGDEQSNRLLVSTSPRYLDTVRKMVEELDATPPQVMIQVLIAEVTLDTSKQWGIDFNVLPFGGEGYSLGKLAAETGVLTALGVPNLSVASTDFELLVRSLEAQGRLEVLSRPQILVNDNEPARIQVGEEVGIVSNVRVLDNGNTSSTVERQDVGIIVEVTPSISSDGFVRMDILPEISSLSQRTTQVSEDFESPVITKREVSTVVTVKDNETIVIGGLIQTTDEERKTRVPLLADIPGVGEFFKSSEYDSIKTELLVILTPRVVQLNRDGAVETIRDISTEEFERLTRPGGLRDLLPPTAFPNASDAPAGPPAPNSASTPAPPAESGDSRRYRGPVGP